MSLFTRARPGLRVRNATSADTPRLLEYLDRRPVENVFLSHVLRRDGIHRLVNARFWYLAEDDGELRGTCIVSTTLVPAADSAKAAAALGRAVAGLRPGTQSVVGERSVVSEMWEILRPRSPAPRLVREEQPFYVRDRDDPSGTDDGRLRVRAARSGDLDFLVRTSADMLREEILDDPYRRDPTGFRAQVWRMIQERAIFVGEVDGVSVFKAHATVRTPHAAQISGVYTVPARRRRGYGRAGMEALARRLLADHPQLCLYVNADNAPAIRVYEAAGFRREGTFKSIFLTRGAD